MDDKLEKVNQGQVVSSISGEEALIADVVVKTITEVANIMNDYAKCRQEQITERQRIRAQLKAVTAQIQADKEKYIYAIDKFYEDKNRFYDIMEQALKNCEKCGDIEMMKVIYDGFFNFQRSKVDELKVLTGQDNNFVKFIE